MNVIFKLISYFGLMNVIFKLISYFGPVNVIFKLISYFVPMNVIFKLILLMARARPSQVDFVRAVRMWSGVRAKRAAPSECGLA